MAWDLGSQATGSGSAVLFRLRNQAGTVFVESDIKVCDAFGIRDQIFVSKNGIRDNKPRYDNH